MPRHTVAGVYVDPEGDPIEGRVVLRPVRRGVSTTGEVVMPSALAIDLVDGAFTASVVACTPDWWWEILEPDGTRKCFDLAADLDVSDLTDALPPLVQVTGPAGPTGPTGPQGPQGPEGVQGPIGEQGSAVLPDTGWVDVRPSIVPPFIADTTAPPAQIRRIGSQVSVRMSAVYDGDGSHTYRNPLPILTVPQGFREAGWRGGVGFGHVANRFLSVDLDASDHLMVADLTSTSTHWSRSAHVTLQASWTTDDPLPPGTGTSGELPWATAAPSPVSLTGAAGTSKLIPHADHVHAGFTVTRTPATGRWLAQTPDGGALELGDSGRHSIVGDARMQTTTVCMIWRLGNRVTLFYAASVGSGALAGTTAGPEIVIPQGFRSYSALTCGSFRRSDGALAVCGFPSGNTTAIIRLDSGAATWTSAHSITGTADWITTEAWPAASQPLQELHEEHATQPDGWNGELE